MSDKSQGWWSTATSGVAGGLVLLVVPGLAQWLFPDWSTFFAAGSKWMGVVWDWLTAEWKLPAVPVLVLFSALIFSVYRGSVRVRALNARWAGPGGKLGPVGADFIEEAATAAGAVTLSMSGGGSTRLYPVPPGGEPPLDFTAAESAILRTLLHAQDGFVIGRDIENGLDHPPLVVRDAGASLEAKGMISIDGGLLRHYSLTAKGQALLIKLWNAAKNR